MRRQVAAPRMGTLAAWSTLMGEVLERGLGLREESVFDVNIALADGKQKEKCCLGVLSRQCWHSYIHRFSNDNM